MARTHASWASTRVSQAHCFCARNRKGRATELPVSFIWLLLGHRSRRSHPSVDPISCIHTPLRTPQTRSLLAPNTLCARSHSPIRSHSPFRRGACAPTSPPPLPFLHPRLAIPRPLQIRQTAPRACSSPESQVHTNASFCARFRVHVGDVGRPTTFCDATVTLFALALRRKGPPGKTPADSWLPESPEDEFVNPKDAGCRIQACGASKTPSR